MSSSDDDERKPSATDKPEEVSKEEEGVEEDGEEAAEEGSNVSTCKSMKIRQSIGISKILLTYFWCIIAMPNASPTTQETSPTG